MSGVRPARHTLLGVTDETYGVELWVARIQGLQAHLRIIGNYLPEDHWLQKQVAAGLDEGECYVKDYAPVQKREMV